MTKEYLITLNGDADVYLKRQLTDEQYALIKGICDDVDKHARHAWCPTMGIHPVESMSAHEIHSYNAQECVSKDYHEKESTYKADWYCPICKKHIPGNMVTFNEYHDERYGGCGGKVV